MNNQLDEANPDNEEKNNINSRDSFAMTKKYLNNFIEKFTKPWEPLGPHLEEYRAYGKASERRYDEYIQQINELNERIDKSNELNEYKKNPDSEPLKEEQGIGEDLSSLSFNLTFNYLAGEVVPGLQAILFLYWLLIVLFVSILRNLVETLFYFVATIALGLYEGVMFFGAKGANLLKTSRIDDNDKPINSHNLDTNNNESQDENVEIKNLQEKISNTLKNAHYPDTEIKGVLKKIPEEGLSAINKFKNQELLEHTIALIKSMSLGNQDNLAAQLDSLLRAELELLADDKTSTNNSWANILMKNGAYLPDIDYFVKSLKNKGAIKGTIVFENHEIKASEEFINKYPDLYNMLQALASKNAVSQIKA